ncbi:hypothetical protein BaRGS_00033350 [Batillaria attramentaria]|uniref:Saposin B-type domain-containing protein n=1 Tax=Batillaria attramentaria TaxID=370345 RepID=A0ABD0JKC4_9CAEN
MLRVLAFVCVIFAVTTGAPSDYLCGVCLDATQDIRTAVRDQQVHARILGQLEGVCAKAGPGKEECNDVITGLTQEVLQYLLADMKPVDLCRAMTVCSAQPVERPQVVRKQVANPMENLTCELCEVIVEEIDRLVTNSSTPAEANRTVYTVCEALPEPLRDTCVTFAPLLLDMLLDGVSPIGACTNLGVCLLGQYTPNKK